MVLSRVRKRLWLVPYSGVDVAVWVFLVYVWGFTVLLVEKDFGYDNVVYELIGLGGLFGVLLCVRLPFLWRHPEWKRKFALATAVVMFLATVLSAAFTPYIGKKEDEVRHEFKIDTSPWSYSDFSWM